MEPEKCKSWEWQSWADIKGVIAREHGNTKVFLPIVNLLKEHPDIETLLEVRG
jgi:hypothetical protein